MIKDDELSKIMKEFEERFIGKENNLDRQMVLLRSEVEELEDFIQSTYLLGLKAGKEEAREIVIKYGRTFGECLTCNNQCPEKILGNLTPTDLN